MKKVLIHTLLESAWIPHSVCFMVALLGSVPLLWLDTAAAALLPYAGYIILGALLTSIVILIISCVRFLLRLQNLRTIGQVCAWVAQAGIAALLFSQMAIEANLSAPEAPQTAETPLQPTTFHQPSEKLTGPASLTIPITPEEHTADKVSPAPNLVRLEQEHESLLADFLSRCPRWAYAAQDDTFYTKPGHVVLVPPATGGIPGTVHATFRTIAEGERLPAGFMVVTPGGDFPKAAEEEEGIPDIALELSGKHFLLLAWRGTKHRETAAATINAAITAIDERFEHLADTPTQETVERLLKGRPSMLGNKTELRLCEPTSQYGVYQAEVYANPGQAGTLLLVVREAETGNTLSFFSCPAQYSDNPNEVFRHDIPGTAARWTSDYGETAHAFPEGAPYFAIRLGQSHQYFGVTLEVQFSPRGSDGTHPQTLLLRHYKVQAYEIPTSG